MINIIIKIKNLTYLIMKINLQLMFIKNKKIYSN